MKGSTHEQLAQLSAEKDALFCELYRAHAAAHGPPALAGLEEALATAKQLGIKTVRRTRARPGVVSRAQRRSFDR